LLALTREEPAEGGQEGAVRALVPYAATELAFKDPHLVTEHDQLDVLVSLTTPGRRHERKDSAQPEVHQRKDHGP
jgi:hypothetical protein